MKCLSVGTLSVDEDPNRRVDRRRWSQSWDGGSWRHLRPDTHMPSSESSHLFANWETPFILC